MIAPFHGLPLTNLPYVRHTTVSTAPDTGIKFRRADAKRDQTGSVDNAAISALDAVRQRAHAAAPTDLERTRAMLPSITVEMVADACCVVRRNARLTLNFHPDRLTPVRESVAAGLLRTGRYLPQSHTGLSNGMRFSPHGGARSRWEAELFAGAYHLAPVDDTIVGPVYGALDVWHDPFGGAPRFGSSFFVLKRDCFDRTTFCVGDSHAGPTDVGTIDAFTSIIAGLIEQRGPQLIETLEAGPPRTGPDRNLDDYIEIQVHGEVLLERDVAAVVVDPSFHDTAVHHDLAAAARAFDFELSWHEGSQLAAADVRSDFRGATMPALARSLAVDGMIDAAAIGRSLAAVPYSEPTPDGDPIDGPLQQHKYLWHCLLHFGHAASPKP